MSQLTILIDMKPEKKSGQKSQFGGTIYDKLQFHADRVMSNQSSLNDWTYVKTMWKHLKKCRPTCQVKKAMSILEPAIEAGWQSDLEEGGSLITKGT
jgi:hypothetical protein